MHPGVRATLFSLCLVIAPLIHAQTLTNSELSKLRSVENVAASPDGRYVAYTIMMRDQPGRPYGQQWVIEASTGKPYTWAEITLQAAQSGRAIAGGWPLTAQTARKPVF